ncbi:cytochrome b/b6 domain-containing protein [Rhizobium sp. CAU 1783]
MADASQELQGARSARETRAEWIKVWDPFVRLFHWSLVGLFAFSYATGDEWKSAHVVSGYLIGSLIAMRVLWGLFGSEHARFVNFIYSPVTVLSFLADTARMRAKRYIGHNPAGGAMVIALLLTVGGIATTGYMMTTDAYWGIEWVEDTHKILVNVALGLIALHVAGVVLASVEHGENLVRAMVTGRKRSQ